MSIKPTPWNYKKYPLIKSGKKKISYRKRESSSITTMVNRSSLRDHTIVADKYLTKLSAMYTGKLTAGTNGIFTVYGNSIYEPFNTANLVSGIMSGTQGSSVTATPMGYTAIAGLYSSYRVKASRIKISVNPTALTDTCNIIVIPVPQNFNVTNSYEIYNQRYARWKTCSSSNNIKENTIIHYMTSSQVLGLTKRQYDDQLSVATGAAPPALLDWYWEVIYEAGTSVAPASPVIFSIEIDMYVEWSDPTQQIS
jgi:hypothetical protein